MLKTAEDGRVEPEIKPLIEKVSQKPRAHRRFISVDRKEPTQAVVS